MKTNAIFRALILCFAAVMLIAVFAGCSPSDPDAPAVSADAGSFSTEDIALKFGQTTVRCGDDVTAILGALGSDYSYTESPSCNYAHNGPNGDDGMDKFYDYAEAAITTCPFQPGGDFIRSVEAWGTQWTTDDGIGIGSTLSDIEAVYGSGYADEYGMIIFYADPQDPASSQLYFLMEGINVAGIGIA